MESCGAPRESFIRCEVNTPLTTTPPAPGLAVHYSQANVEITCSHHTAAMPPPPAALGRPPPAFAHRCVGDGVVRGAA
eukprot:3934349-Prymnesium_polylepis.1